MSFDDDEILAYQKRLDEQGDEEVGSGLSTCNEDDEYIDLLKVENLREITDLSEKYM